MLVPSLPNQGIPAAVEDCQHNDALCFEAKVDAVWEATNDKAADALMNLGIQLRLSGNQGDAAFDFDDEFIPETRTFTLIPICCVNELCTSGAMKRDRQGHR